MGAKVYDLRELLFSKIKEHWLSPFFVRLIQLVKALRVLSGDSQRVVIGIYAQNSHNWILLYFASIFAGLKLVIYPRYMTNVQIRHAIMNDSVNYLFLNNKTEDQILYAGKPVIQKKMFVLKGVFNLETFKPLFCMDSVLELVKLFQIVMSNDFNIPKQLGVEDFDSLANNYFPKNANPEIVSYTSGITRGIRRPIPMYEHNIVNLLMSLEESGFAEKISFGDVIHSHVPFSESHYLTVLFPLFQGAKTSFSTNNANVIIEDTTSFELMWSNVVDSLMEGKFLNNILRRKTFRWLYERLVKNRLHHHYHYNTKKTAIIIYNCFVHERAIFESKDKLPLVTTYGLQELGQIVAYNDFSVPMMHNPNCVGVLIPNTDIIIKPASKEIAFDSKVLNYTMDTPLFSTGDIGSLQRGITPETKNTNYLFVYGRKIARVLDSSNMPVQLDNLERYFRGIPYIQQCVIIQRKDTFMLLVMPELHFIDAKNINMHKLKVLLKAYIKNISRLEEVDIDIEDVKIMPKPLDLNPGTNQVVRFLYNHKFN